MSNFDGANFINCCLATRSRWGADPLLKYGGLVGAMRHWEMMSLELRSMCWQWLLYGKAWCWKDSFWVLSLPMDTWISINLQEIVDFLDGNQGCKYQRIMFGYYLQILSSTSIWLANRNHIMVILIVATGVNSCYLSTIGDHCCFLTEWWSQVGNCCKWKKTLRLSNP